MFVGDEVMLELSFRSAQASLANLAQGGSLTSASEGAYGDGLASLIRVGPIGAVPGVSKLVEVRFRDLVIRDDTALLTLRWEATGPGGGLFPALDADITLTPAGEQATRLTLAGAYRPPLAGPGRRARPGDLAPGGHGDDPLTAQPHGRCPRRPQARPTAHQRTGPSAHCPRHVRTG